MAIMKKDTLEPGEIRVGDPCPHGHIPYERLGDQGQVERGVLVRCVNGQPPSPGATAIIRMGEYVSADKRKIATYRPLHGGPPSVASDAYRTGWDAIFAKPRGKVREEKPN